MSKKQVKNKPAKKAVKPAKKATPAKKAKPAKTVSAGKPKKAAKPAKKIAVKKAAKKVVSKKTIIKKAAKPAKKTLKKAVKSLKAKPIKKTSSGPKKAAAKKPLAKAKTAPKKKTASKPAAKTLKKAVKVTKPVKTAKEKAAAKSKEKELVKPVVATIKSGKPAKAESPKPMKAEKPRRAKKAKAKDDEDEPAIENDPLIEEIIRSTKKKQLQPKKPKIIQTFVNPMASLAVAAPLDSGKKSSAPKKEPKGKFELEYVVRTSAGILYEFLTSPSGLSEWFADDVNIRDGIFTFFWDGSEQKARLLNFKDEKYVRMQWFDKPEGSYFEFRIDKDELTGDVSLIITDFADEGSDLETSKLLWDTQVNKLLHVIGSY